MGFVAKLGRRIVALTALVAGASALAALPAAAAEPVQIQRSIPYASGSQATAAVREQCGLQTKVPDFIKQFAGEGVQLVDAINPKKGRVLKLEITEVFAPGGGGMSGPKWMSVKGELFDKGKQIGSFRAKRYSTGGVFGGYKGTCAIIGRCSKTIGQDIASWLAAPTKDAELGDAH